jgi:hypothetical protein
MPGQPKIHLIQALNSSCINGGFANRADRDTDSAKKSNIYVNRTENLANQIRQSW